MTPFPATRPPADDGADRLRGWLAGAALPVWSTTGVDRTGGGFFEKIDLAGRAVEAPRRARVVARQIYVFAVAARRGWLDGADADARVEHGLAFLLGRMRLADGTFAAAVRPDGTVVDARFDLYEHAFILFALATALDGRPDRGALRDEAEALLARLRRGWSHPAGGFEESAPRSLPLRSNPHMHLLEAALAWTEVSRGAAREPWRALAAELVELGLTRFVDPASGALHEEFDGDWRPMPGPGGERVEPGHQFEWAWLLMRWSARTGDARAAAAARRLLEIGEAHGVDPVRGVAVNALGRDLAVVDAAAKLWPQTERIKAWQLASEADASAAEAAAAGASAAAAGPSAEAAARRDAAVAALRRYLLAEPPGLWHEAMRADGTFAPQDCRASSLYHIVCAIDALQPRGTAAP